MPQFNNTKLTTLILNDNKNYILWSRSVIIGLGGKGKLHFVTGIKERPKPEKANEITAAETAQIEEWDINDQMIMSWLLSTMDPKISNVLMYSKSSKKSGTRQEKGTAKPKILLTSLVSNKKSQKSDKIISATMI
jgi:gag-polypeptide of LTR copia-type